MTSKILIVDDEEPICNMVKLHFQTEVSCLHGFRFRRSCQGAREQAGFDTIGYQYAGNQRAGILQKNTKLY